MGKYSDKLINQYIKGFEIENVEELENSKSFMMQAIEKSGDYKLYNLCSDRLKKNYSFVKYLIMKFSDQIDFICDVADYYLNNCNDIFSRIEIASIMIELTKSNKEKYMRYRMCAHSLYFLKRIQIEAIKKNLDDEELKDELGMGFLLIFEEYSSSKIVLDFFAKRIIDGIFDEFNINLEDILHEKFTNPEEINELGINNYMLNFIIDYDVMLYNYLCVNINLLDEFRKRITNAQKNWMKYEIKKECNKFNILFDKVHEYLLENESMIDETSFLYYIGSELGIADKILEYDSVFMCSLDELIEEIDFDMVKEIISSSFVERVHYMDIKRIMSDIIFSKNNNSVNDTSKILRINFRKNKE